MIAIIDYGCGNLFSLSSSLESLGIECRITSDKDEIRNADKIILPGVGAFADAAKKLKESGLGELVISLASEGKPILGICLGMQLLFEKSYEYGEYEGLGLIKGSVRYMDEPDLIIPHMGWNKLEKLNECPLLENIGDNEYVYFVHSYKAECADKNISAYSEYGGKVPALVFDGKFVYGAQFHPEKSGETGLKILRSFGGLI